MYQGTRLAAAEAINSGITFVHDWCHNIRSPDYAEADLRALKESGLRARFSYGRAQGHDANSDRSTSPISRSCTNDWTQYSNDGLIALGLAWRGMGGNMPANAVPRERLARRDRGRAQARPAALGAFQRLEGRGRPDRRASPRPTCSKDVQIIHAV